MKRFVHILSFPEHIWGDFFRSFFSQDVLITNDDGEPIPNMFKYDESEIPANRKFDIMFEHDFSTANPNILPALVIEDMGMASLGIATNRLVDWSVSPQTIKTRSDLLRSSYTIHCCSKDRGESRLMAGIVASAITTFYDSLLEAGIHKIDPWQIGKTIPIKSDASEVYVSTPVMFSFETQQTWKTVENGSGFAERFCIRFINDSIERFIRTSMDVEFPSASSFINTSMDVDNQNTNQFINTEMLVSDPLLEELFLRTSMNAVDPQSLEGYVRTSMRVSA